MFDVGIISVVAIFLLLQGGEYMLVLILQGLRTFRRALIGSPVREPLRLVGSSIFGRGLWRRATGICPYGIGDRLRGGGWDLRGLQTCRENVQRSLANREWTFASLGCLRAFVWHWLLACMRLYRIDCVLRRGSLLFCRWGGFGLRSGHWLRLRRGYLPVQF